MVNCLMCIGLRNKYTIFEIRIRRWNKKKRNILRPYSLNLSAVSRSPRMIYEKLLDKPHEGHGSPVIFSCIHSMG